MRSSLSLLAALVVMSSVALAQNRRPVRRADAGVASAPAVTDASAPSATDASTAASSADASAPAGPTCCCRAWSHGWQYAWRAERECAAQNGTCVSPDHC